MRSEPLCKLLLILIGRVTLSRAYLAVNADGVRSRFFVPDIDDSGYIKTPVTMGNSILRIVYKGIRNMAIMGTLCLLTLCSSVSAQLGIWTSAEELANKPMTGIPWEAVKTAADAVNPQSATVSDQDSNNNADILAAAIVYARTGDEAYKTKVVDACQRLVNGEKPDDRTLAWARETGAYAMAADLVGYRTVEFETWLRNMAEVYVATDGRTLLYMFQLRPNNWGTQGFGSLCAIYAYLQDATRLNEVRDHWIQEVVGPKPDIVVYGEDKSWHVDSDDLRLINPKGAIKEGLNIDGIIPDDMRRGTSFKNPPDHTGYAWETLQGIISGARILERSGMPIWGIADSAIYRAGYAIQVRWENQFGSWKAEADDLWMLHFFDDAYGTNWADGQLERVWEHGKNAGWPYVVWDGTLGNTDSQGNMLPNSYKLGQNYPNPFNPATNILFTIPQSGPVSLTIYDLLGRPVTTLFDGVKQAGVHTITWESLDSEGSPLPSGIYICQLGAGSINKNIKMTSVR
ncbi:T9SS type A sorting domain-containing protein [Candidatus Neomarinimicrobiota bacterium]